MSNLRGMATVSFFAADLEAAKNWYTEVLGTAPYFERPGYIEFRIGDFQNEFGIIDSTYVPGALSDPPAGAILYWHVDELTATVDRLLSLGAKPHQPETERGPGFVTASVIDPFGNILGVMYNAHFVEIAAAAR